MSRATMVKPFAFDVLLEHTGLPTNELAARCGVLQRQIYRWKADGLTVAQADRLACRLGFHPSEVWADWYEESA